MENILNINTNVTKTLQIFLQKHKNSYFIIGGHAAAYNLDIDGISFRVTRDYDIVIISEVDDEQFAFDLCELLLNGKYKFGFKSNSQKKIAYRFENPINNDYPEIIEFFIKEGVYIQSIDNRFAKLNITVNNEKISAMVLDEDIYNFSKRHVLEIKNLMFVDKKCLIGLKSYAYFENLKLYQNNKVTSDNYKKHARDILRLLGSLKPNEITPINDLPSSIKESMKDIKDILIKSRQQLKEYGLSKELVLSIMNILIN